MVLTLNGAANGKKCFVISPIGDDSTPERKEMKEHANLVLEHFIRPALKDVVGQVVRADEISKPGDITRQVLDALATYELVVADLSYHNANVFYELAIRHMLGKPYVQMIRKGEKIPFDVGQQRTIMFDPRSIPELEQTRKLIKDFSEASLSGPVETPLGTAVSVESLKSDDPVQQSLSLIVARLDQMGKGFEMFEDLSLRMAHERAMASRSAPETITYTLKDLSRGSFRKMLSDHLGRIAYAEKEASISSDESLSRATAIIGQELQARKVMTQKEILDILSEAF